MCTVGGLLLAMVQNKPLVSATAIAVMSAPFASTAAARRSTACTRSTGCTRNSITLCYSVIRVTHTYT